MDIVHSGTKKHAAIFHGMKPAGFCRIGNLTFYDTYRHSL